MLNLFMLATACLPHAAAPQAAANATPTAVVGLLTQEGVVSALPGALDDALQDTLRARNLVPQAVAVDQLSGARRTSSYRMAALAQAAPGATLDVLVETDVEFYSQLSGRYRWTVHVKASVAESARLSEALSSEFTVPVFLEYDHEREPAALEAASPVIQRQVGYLLDEFIGATAPAAGE